MVEMTSAIEDTDFERKKAQIFQFLQQGYQVKVSISNIGIWVCGYIHTYIHIDSLGHALICNCCLSVLTKSTGLHFL